jgi:hypothetical protein
LFLHEFTHKLRAMTLHDRVRVHEATLLSDHWYTLKTTAFDWRRNDGKWQRMHRETYDRGNGATLLPYNLAQRTVLLTRQFRYPAFVNGHDEPRWPRRAPSRSKPSRPT